MTWQPIDTAPRDISILLYCISRNAMWIDAIDRFENLRFWGVVPTHWMSLPPPPEIEQ